MMMTIVMEFVSHDLKEYFILIVATISAEKVSKHLHGKARDIHQKYLAKRSYHV